MFAWYSEKQSNSFGFAIFMSEDGSYLRVSETSYTDKPSGSWDDYIFLGNVAKQISNHNPDGSPRSMLTMKDLYREIEIDIDESDIIDTKECVVISALSKNAKSIWNAMAEKITIHPFKPVFSASFAKRPTASFTLN